MSQNLPNISDAAGAVMRAIRVPFAGFYCSVHDAAMDDGLAMINTDGDGESFTRIESDNIDWRMVRLSYVQGYLKELSEAIDVPLNFCELVSPKFYNFESDALYANIPAAFLEDLYGKVCADHDMAARFRDHVKAVLEPRSGFIPFYPDILDSWGGYATWDEVQVSVLIDFWSVETEIDEYEIAEKQNVRVESAIFAAIIDLKKVLDPYDADNDGPTV